MAISKVILNGEVQMDVTSDTVEANKLLNGETATKNDGTKVTGTYVPPDPQVESLAITPTEEKQTFNSAAIDGYKPVVVDAINSEYIGSDITRRSSTDLTTSGATVNVPAGYYANNSSKSIASGTAGTPTASKGSVSNHSISITPSVTNTAGYISGGTKNGTTVSVSASELVSGTKSITENGSSIDVTNYALVNVEVPDIPAVLQEKSATPTETTQIIIADSGYDGLSEVEIGAISSTYIGSEVSRQDSTNLTVDGATVTAPAGYYADNASKAIPNGSAKTPNTSIIASPTISINSTGLITASESGSKSVTPEVSAGYISEGTAGTISVSGSATKQLTTQVAKTVTPTESEQTAVAANVYTTGAVKVGAIDSEYIGSDIARRSSTDLTALGAIVSVPAGYYSEAVSKSIASGTAGTPTASKGTVSNHSVNITPSVTNTEGYISGGTKTGSAVNVSASELVSGTKNITTNGTGIDVTNYKTANVAIEPKLEVLNIPFFAPNETFASDRKLVDHLYIDNFNVKSTSGVTKAVSTKLVNGETYYISGYVTLLTSRSMADFYYREGIALSGTWTCGDSLLPFLETTSEYLTALTLTNSQLSVTATTGGQIAVGSYQYFDLVLDFYNVSQTSYDGLASVTTGSGLRVFRNTVRSYKETDAYSSLTFEVPAPPLFFIIKSSYNSNIQYIIFDGSTTIMYRDSSSSYAAMNYSNKCSFSYSDHKLTVTSNASSSGYYFDPGSYAYYELICVY